MSNCSNGNFSCSPSVDSTKGTEEDEDVLRMGDIPDECQHGWWRVTSQVYNEIGIF